MHRTTITGDQLANIFADLTLTSHTDEGWTWSISGDHPALGPIVIHGDAGATYQLSSKLS